MINEPAKRRIDMGKLKGTKEPQKPISKDIKLLHGVNSVDYRTGGTNTNENRVS